MVLLSSLIGISYGAVIGSFIKGIYQTTEIPAKDHPQSTTFSIIIAVRNEEENLTELFSSLENLAYNPKHFEIIFVDDHSEDTSLLLLKEFQKQTNQLDIRILQNQGSGKKEAVTTAVHQAKFDYILTTDADCSFSHKWIQAYNTLLTQKKYHYLTGPVCIKQASNFLNQFQFIEFLSLQGSTLGSFANKMPFMSNAANSCYLKEIFISLDGYHGNSEVASGDDIFLLEKIMHSNAKKVGYLNSVNGLVYTAPESTWKKVYHQKIRWAAKATLYKNKIGITVGSIVFLTNSLLLILLGIDWKLALYLFGFKFIIDFVLLKKTTNFFKENINFGYVILCSFCYPVFSTGIFILSQITNFEWKGRQLKK